MQERRFRPGDALDDYCPRERRLTDHAVVAMIDDTIGRTRCTICESEHAYKGGKVPTRRKAEPVPLFTQVLDSLQGPTPRPPPSLPAADSTAPPPDTLSASSPDANPLIVPPVAAAAPTEEAREDGQVRRSLIRAQFPKIEGQSPMPRALHEFTIHTLHNRGGRPGGGSGRPGSGQFRGRRHGGESMDPNAGPMRFGRENGHGQGNGSGRTHGPVQGGHRRRGSKKNG